MRYKNEKLLQVRRKAAELDIGLSIALQKILLDVFQSDEEIAEEQFSRGWNGHFLHDPFFLPGYVKEIRTF